MSIPIRHVALSVIAILKRVREPNGMTLKAIHEYMKAAYPKRHPTLQGLSSVLEKATAIGTLQKKKNKYNLSSIINKKLKAQEAARTAAQTEARRSSRKRKEKSRSRRRRRGSKSRSRRSRKSRSRSRSKHRRH